MKKDTQIIIKTEDMVAWGGIQKYNHILLIPQDRRNADQPGVQDFDWMLLVRKETPTAKRLTKVFGPTSLTKKQIDALLSKQRRRSKRLEN